MYYDTIGSAKFKTFSDNCILLKFLRLFESNYKAKTLFHFQTHPNST